MLNGFHTNAYCIDGGTGGRFAELPVPDLAGAPALTVRNAWAQMAFDKEPGGRRASARWATSAPAA